jgi:hypothetical protein
MKKTMLLFTLVLLACVTLVTAGIVGKVSGRITDEKTGEPLPGVNVIVEGLPFGAVTDLDGYFYIINVRPGNYTLRATLMGYEGQKQAPCVVQIDRTTTMNFKMKQTVLSSGQEVTVVAERAIVPMDVSNTQTMIETQQIASNSFQDVGDIVGYAVGIEGGERPSIRGAGWEQSAFVVDGIQLVDEVASRPLYKVPLGAIQEMNIITGGFNAEYGNVRSGIVNIITKEGGDRYSGSANFRYRPAGVRNFGPAPYSSGDPLVKNMVDWNAGAFTGYKMASAAQPLLGADGKPVKNFMNWQGWYKYAGVDVDANGMPKLNADGSYVLGKSGNLKPGDAHYGKPYEALAKYLWQHRSTDNLNLLKSLAQQGLIGADLANVSDDDVIFDTGNTPDYDVDASFGGPVPFLKDVKFFASYSRQVTEYSLIRPVDGYDDHNATFKLNWQITPSMKLMSNFMYNRQTGEAHGQGPSAFDGSYLYNSYYMTTEGNKYWYPHCAVPGRQERMFGGLTFTHVLSPSTYYEVLFNTSYSTMDILWEDRNTQPIYGNIFGNHNTALGNGRIGTTAYADSMALLDAAYAKGDEAYLNSKNPNWSKEISKFYGYTNWRDWASIKIGEQWYDESPWGYGPINFRDETGVFRLSSCNMRLDDSYARQYNLKAAITSQVNRYNQVKAGFEVVRDDIHVWYDAIDPSVNGGSRNWAFAKPWRLGAYIQDKLEFQGMIANIGVRVDGNISGEMFTPNDDFNDKVNGPFSTYLRAGYKDSLYVPTVWQRNTKVYVSPRIGISHPISDNAKIFFNYGHFYRWPDTQQMYRVEQSRPNNWRIAYVGNAELNPPRTIQYEVGYSHNIANTLRVTMTGYYRDIQDQILDNLYYRYLDNTEWRTWQNAQYADVRGFEAEVNLPVWGWFSGFVNYNYMISSTGEYGFSRYYEDTNKIPDRRTTSVSQPAVRPILKANITLHIPDRFGPRVMGWYPLEVMDLGVLYRWQAGQKFTWNPDNIPYVDQNVRWNGEGKSQLRFTKRLFKAGRIAPYFYMDVYNLFNQKYLPYENNSGLGVQPWNAIGEFFTNEFNNYMYSLKPGDNPGDIADDGNPHIVMPGFTPYTFAEKRVIYYGIRLDFTL